LFNVVTAASLPAVLRRVVMLKQFRNIFGSMDVDVLLPGHGDVANRAVVKELSSMLLDEYATVKSAVAKGMPLAEAQRTLTFPQYRDWGNYSRLKNEIEALYELIRTKHRSYFE
jgi:hypothetical protein